MPSFIPYHAGIADQVADFWLSRHPDWKWLSDPEGRAKIMAEDDNHKGFAVMDGKAVVGTMFSHLSKEELPNRFIMIEMAPELVTAEIVDHLLSSFTDVDREKGGIWQVAMLDEKQATALSPILENAGFILHDRSLRMEWDHDEVKLEPPPAGTELILYTGGNPEYDQAIVDLHNRAYRPSRLTPGTEVEHLWPEAWPGLIAREYVLGFIDGKLGGYAEWMTTNDYALMNSLAVSRAYWGTSLAPAVGTKAMERMREAGFRSFRSGVSSRNAASIKLQERFGWKITVEESRRYVRKF
jgi:ribosomal protein S18 acetylase RimI-like enzyme